MYHQAVWTAGELIVWGGIDQCCAIDSYIHAPDAAAYNPKSNRWRVLRDVPAPWSGDDGPAYSVADGVRMLVYRAGHLGAYEVGFDRWRTLPEPHLPRDRCGSTGGPATVAELAEDRLYVWTGGCSSDHGVAYDLRDNRWRRTARAPNNLGAVTMSPAALFAVTHPMDLPQKAGAWSYSIANDRWMELPEPPQPLQLGSFVAWTGTEVLVWGGYGGAQGSPVTGAAYTPDG